ncbi:GNAT family N-acetyltransferase [Bacillus salipaludis]|uniref:GNAT family N-acetyltransferase n=1 Tax=Bacillus salipaludis TaxID=2547811 RepID=A0AA90R7X8_9BACI|nr:GNAT family N-acetyltransferase [Bacillus salipaludis]MDQ6597891.1 GNAT family N-acetyltransferase [Bacillus salipaludis]
METTIRKVDQEQVWGLRHEVMWSDKPFEYIKLEDDDLGIHFGLFKESTLVSVISLFIDNEEAQFRKFATLQQEQGKGFGSELLESVLKEAKIHGVKRIWVMPERIRWIFIKSLVYKRPTLVL